MTDQPVVTRVAPPQADLSPAQRNALLTPDEWQAIDLSAELANALARCHMMAGPDGAEVAGHLHAIQNALLAQAAARAFPGSFRLMGPT